MSKGRYTPHSETIFSLTDDTRHLNPSRGYRPHITTARKIEVKKKKIAAILDQRSRTLNKLDEIKIKLKKHREELKALESHSDE